MRIEQRFLQASLQESFGHRPRVILREDDYTLS